MKFNKSYASEGNEFISISSYYEGRPQLWPAKYQRLYEEQKKVPKEEPPVLKEKDDKVVYYEDFKNAAMDYAIKHHNW